MRSGGLIFKVKIIIQNLKMFIVIKFFVNLEIICQVCFSMQHSVNVCLNLNTFITFIIDTLQYSEPLCLFKEVLSTINDILCSWTSNISKIL